jgi:hypothetical protein
MTMTAERITGVLTTMLVAGMLAGQGCQAVAAADGPTVSVGSLLDEMVDRAGLARWPQPAYTCRQFSSYDRDSVSADKPGWYANWDRSHFVRVEEKASRKEYVLMDAEGPGAVVRFWGTWHGPRGKPFSNGTLRFYLDGSDTPAIEGPITEVLDGGRLVGPPLAQGVSPETDYRRRGHNLYLPIPYARRCKVTYSTDVLVDVGGKKGEALYYQINYRTYTKGTPVETFSAARLKELQPKVEAAQRRLSASGPDKAKRRKIVRFDGKLAPGASRAVTVEGPAAIRQLSVKLSADDLPQALRSTVLEIAFDGESAVWCPVGDFFGIGYQLRPCRTWYTQVTADGVMTCWWAMPFAKSCRITLHNLGARAVTVNVGEAQPGDWSWDDRSMHFHATWRQYPKVHTGSTKTMAQRAGARDVNYVAATGRGVYVGDTLTLFNGVDAWWGEGDEKVYVDGETFPSHFGTGTEDYYGYAWCRPEAFSAPFHAQPEGGGNLAGGYSVNSRYRALDAIPFARSLKFDMELWHWRNTNMDYAPATFWYARPGAGANVKPDPAAARRPVTLRREQIVQVRRVPGAIEAESLKVASKTGGRTVIQNIPKFRWSNDRQLWWVDTKIGDRLVIEFPVKQAGRYKVSAALTKAPDYGIVKLQVNAAPAGRFDLYHTIVDHDLHPLGVFDLKAGPNRLTIEMTGINPKSLQRRRFGLDYLLLQPDDAKRNR